MRTLVSSELYNLLEASRILPLLVEIGRKIWLLSQEWTFCVGKR